MLYMGIILSKFCDSGYIDFRLRYCIICETEKSTDGFKYINDIHSDVCIACQKEYNEWARAQIRNHDDVFPVH